MRTKISGRSVAVGIAISAVEVAVLLGRNSVAMVTKSIKAVKRIRARDLTLSEKRSEITSEMAHRAIRISTQSSKIVAG